MNRLSKGEKPVICIHINAHDSECGLHEVPDSFRDLQCRGNQSMAYEDTRNSPCWGGNRILVYLMRGFLAVSLAGRPPLIHVSYLMFFESRGTRSESPPTNTIWAAVFKVERGTALKGNSFGSCTFALDVILGAVGVVGDNTERLLIPYLQSLIALSVWGLALFLASCCGLVHWCFQGERISYWQLSQNNLFFPNV